MVSIALICCCFLAIPEVTEPAFTAANEELADYLLEAARNHPQLLARYEAWRAALERIPQAKALEDPMLGYTQFLQSDVNRANFMLSQKFPWFATLRARGDRAAANADAVLARFYAERNAVFAAVKRAYFEYAYLGKAIEITEGQLEILDFVEEIARTNYSLAMTTQDDLLRIHIEQTKLQDRLDEFNQMRPALSARLNDALGRPVLEELPWPQPAAFPEGLPQAEEVLAMVRAHNPELEALDHVIGGREHEKELARKKGYPDITVGLEYMAMSKPRQIRPDRPYPASLNAARRLFNTANGSIPLDGYNTLVDIYAVGTTDEPMSYSDGGDDNIALTLSVNVPVWRKKVKAGIAEAGHMVKEAESDKHRRELTLDAAARMTLFELQDAQRRYRLYDQSLLPQARQVYENLQAEYAAGAFTADFLDLLNSVQTLLDFELEQARAWRDALSAAADLEELMGGPGLKAIPGQAP